MARGFMSSSLLSGRADCGLIVTESAHRVRSTCGSVASEGGGKQVPTPGGGYRLVTDARASTSEEVSG